jgi:hypothetical protein
MATNQNGPASAASAEVALQSEEQRAELGDVFDVLLRRSLQARFGTAVSEPVPDHLLRLISEDAAEREEDWGGPSYGHRGARIECRPGGYVCRLVMKGHPLDRQAFGPAGDGVPLIDLWLDEGLLPDRAQVGLGP